jgi:indoleamine 2,3-dioxygenase
MASGDCATVERHLDEIAVALEAMNATLRRMPEYCDPYIYFHRVRPFIHGWKGHPSLHGGLLYCGNGKRRDKRLELRGETGAQSSIVPALDALLGVPHAPDPLRTYLEEMKGYMPPGHRRFLAAVEEGPDLGGFISRCGGPDSSLAERRDDCLHWLEAFRTVHLEYAALYIHQQARTNASNPSHVGTGGTPFMSYLAKHRDETAFARGK